MTVINVDLLVIVPLVAALAAAVAGRAARWVSLAGSVATLGVLASLAGSGVFTGQAVSGAAGVASVVPFWALVMDGLSTPLVALTAFLGLIAVLASWGVSERPAPHHALLLALEAAVMGVFLAEDIILFYVFWEAVLIPMYFLIGVWGHERRRHAATKFFLYTLAASALMLVGILMAWFAAGTSRIPDMAADPSVLPATAVFWLLTIGMLVKIPVVPLHTWLPDAHVEAPTAGSIMLAGVLLKMGGYGLIRLVIPLAPTEFALQQPFFAALGIIGIVWGAAMAFAQTDLKRLVAYSSVAHMGFVVLAISTGTAAGLSGAMLGMVSHGVVAALLFLLVGQLYERAHTREIARFGGLGKIVPGWASALTFGALASLGLPGLSGFPGEFVAVIEGFRSFEWWVLPATVGVVLGAAYNLRAVREVNHGPRSGEWATLADLGPADWVPVVLLMVPIVVLGVWPALVTDIAEHALAAIAMLVSGGM